MMKKIFVLGLILVLLLPSLPLVVAEEQSDEPFEFVFIFGTYDGFNTDGDGTSCKLASEGRNLSFAGLDYDQFNPLYGYWPVMGKATSISYDDVFIGFGFYLVANMNHVPMLIKQECFSPL